MATIALRPYQQAQVAGAEAAWAAGVRSAMIVAATGTGKTSAVGELARRAVDAGETVLFVAHRFELLDQAKKTFEEDFGLQVGLERGSSRAGAEPVVVASVQTLRGERLEGFPRDAFDKIFVDECHHAAASSYLDILAHFHTAKVMGVTATPDRADAKPLAVAFERVVHRYEIDQAIGEGFLVPVRGIQITVRGLDLSKVRQRRQTSDGSRERPGETIDLLAPAGQARVAPKPRGSAERYAVDLHPGDLGKAVIAPAAVEGIVTPMLQLAGDRRTIVFAVDMNHAYALAEAICAKRGVDAARVVHHKMKKRDRKAVQDAHKAGEFQYLINMVLLTEGYNDPAIECVVMARPTQSRVLYCQAVGRALRLYAGKIEALLLDFVGVGCKFDLVGPADALGAALVNFREVDPSQIRRRQDRVAVPTVRRPEPIDIGDWLANKFNNNPLGWRAAFKTKAIKLIRGTGGFFKRLFGG